MAKFSEIVKGSRARKRDVKFTTLTGAETSCDLRVLSGADDESILAAAVDAAKKAKAQPVEGDIVFDFARACEVVFRAAVDPESAEDKPEPFFDSVEQVKEHLDRERIYLLFEAQCAYQDEASPRASRMSVDDLVQHIYTHALAPEGAELPFERWQPVLRRSFVRTLVDLCVNSDALRSHSSSASGTTSSSTSDISRPS